MLIKKCWNITQKIPKQKNNCVLYKYTSFFILLFFLCLTACATRSPTDVSLVEESAVPASIVWERFIEKYPSTLSPFRMKISAKLSASILTRRFSMYAWGDGNGIVRVDISSSGVSFLKIMENPIDSIFFLTSSNKGYITRSDNYSELSSLIGISIPFSLENLCAILTQNSSSVFKEYRTHFPRENMIEFILTDKSRLFLAYNGDIIAWESKNGWRIVPIYTFSRKQEGIIATFLPKGYSIEYKVDSLDSNVYFSASELILRLPPKTAFFRVQPKQ